NFQIAQPASSRPMAALAYITFSQNGRQAGADIGRPVHMATISIQRSNICVACPAIGESELFPAASISREPLQVRFYGPRAPVPKGRAFRPSPAGTRSRR